MILLHQVTRTVMAVSHWHVVDHLVMLTLCWRQCWTGGNSGGGHCRWLVSMECTDEQDNIHLLHNTDLTWLESGTWILNRWCPSHMPWCHPSSVTNANEMQYPDCMLFSYSCIYDIDGLVQERRYRYSIANTLELRLSFITCWYMPLFAQCTKCINDTSGIFSQYHLCILIQMIHSP